MDIRTTAGETFTKSESQEMARLIYKRFGKELSAAAAAWRRLLQNNCSDHQFASLLSD